MDCQEADKIGADVFALNFECAVWKSLGSVNVFARIDECVENGRSIATNALCEKQEDETPEVTPESESPDGDESSAPVASVMFEIILVAFSTMMCA